MKYTEKKLSDLGNVLRNENNNNFSMSIMNSGSISTNNLIMMLHLAYILNYFALT